MKINAKNILPFIMAAAIECAPGTMQPTSDLRAGDVHVGAECGYFPKANKPFNITLLGFTGDTRAACIAALLGECLINFSPHRIGDGNFPGDAGISETSQHCKLPSGTDGIAGTCVEDVKIVFDGGQHTVYTKEEACVRADIFSPKS